MGYYTTTFRAALLILVFDYSVFAKVTANNIIGSVAKNGAIIISAPTNPLNLLNNI